MRSRLTVLVLLMMIKALMEAWEREDLEAAAAVFTTKDPAAWATAHYVFEAQQNEKPVRFEGDVTMVWVRQPDGSHKLSVFHASHLPPAAAA